MEIKFWPFFIIRVSTYNWKYQVKNKYHEICNRKALKKKKHFKDKHLKYAATSRCPCGAGMALIRGLPYAKGLGTEYNYWDCSDILTGRAVAKEKEHTAKLPFAFYEIKSEDQPSAYGATTRPKDK